MFKHLTNFGYKRNTKEAFGFYLAYLVLVLLVGGLAGAMFATDFSSGVIVGTRVAVVVSVFLSCVVLYKKNLFNNFGYLLLVAVSGIAAYFGGGILGLIIPAYLSTR